MTDLVDRTIANLRDMHDELAAVVGGLSDEQLTAQSGAEEWTIADVLSHLGSSAEIGLGVIQTAIGAGAEDTPENQAVWDRWNAMAPRAQADEFLVSEDRLLKAYEALTPEERESLEVDLGFLPAPVSVSMPLGMRLNEMSAHGWDVRVGLEPDATLHADAAELVLEHYTDGMSFLLGYSGKADAIDGAAFVDLGGYGLAIDDSVRLTTDSADPTATFTGPHESFVRLMSGRLKSDHTPAGVDVTGNVTLDDLRRVFPGY